MKTKNKLLALLTFCLFFIGCNYDNDTPNDTPNELFPKTITPVLIAQGKVQVAGILGIVKHCSVIETKVEWENLQTLMNSVSKETDNFAETDVDFSKYQVIAVFNEVTRNSRYNINITNITEYADSIVVEVCNVETEAGRSILTQSYHIVKIPVSNKEIVFHQGEEEFEDPYKDDILGKWKLESASYMYSSPPHDFYENNVIYDFQKNNKLIITSFMSGRLQTIEHSYKYIKTDIRLTGWPAPGDLPLNNNLLIDGTYYFLCSYTTYSKMIISFPSDDTKVFDEVDLAIIEQQGAVPYSIQKYFKKLN